MAHRSRGIPPSEAESWGRTYEKTPYRELPWFSARPYPWVKENVVAGAFRRGSRVLDLGCGAGTNSLFLARSGLRVTGIDLAPGAVDAARARAGKGKVRAEFRVGDVLRLPFTDRAFGGAIDVGCFHTLPVRLRQEYAREVARVLRPEAKLLLSWVAREHQSPMGPPHRPSLEEVTAALEREFLFLRTEFRIGWRDHLPAYHSVLERRSAPQPPPR
ncbi:MAG TPA: class I SAM-dependent methyltransferase [Thermoplasmata archaeon]|nr:class I SAM-dependent methyltransferase [Thermoplasmata archaeon]